MEQRVVKTGVDDSANRSSGSRLAPAQNRCFFSQIVDGSISREHLAEVGWGGVSASTATTALLPMILSSQALEAELKCRQGRATPGRARSSAQTPG